MTFYITAVLAWPVAAWIAWFAACRVPGENIANFCGDVAAGAAAVALALLPFLITGRLA